MVTPRKGLGSFPLTTASMVETLGFCVWQAQGSHQGKGLGSFTLTTASMLDIRVWIGQVQRSHHGKGLGSFPLTTAYMVETLGFGFGNCTGYTKEGVRGIPFDNCIHD